MSKQTDAYFATLGALPGAVRCHDGDGAELFLDEAIGRFVTLARETHEAGNKLIFIGNGGSAGIASHMAIDYSKNGNIRSQAFNDSAALTCLGNDLGYENVFSKQIEKRFFKTFGAQVSAAKTLGEPKNKVANTKYLFTIVS